MMNFCIKVSGFNIVTCTQKHSPAFKVSTGELVNKSGNGTINVSAFDQEDAIRIIKKYLENYKKSNSHLI